jgi:hypothetical protein
MSDEIKKPGPLSTEQARAAQAKGVMPRAHKLRQMALFRELLEAPDGEIASGEPNRTRLESIFAMAWKVLVTSKSSRFKLKAADFLLKHSYGEAPPLNMDELQGRVQVINIALPELPSGTRVGIALQTPDKPLRPEFDDEPQSQDM